MEKKIGVLFICMIFITNAVCFTVAAIDKEQDDAQSLNIEFIFAIGRVRDVEKNPDELYYQFRSISLLIIWFYFYQIDFMQLMLDYTRGNLVIFENFRLIGILTNRFVFGFFLPAH